MTRARALRTVPWVQSIFRAVLALLLWRSAALTGPAFCEFAFCGFEVGEILSVAVVGDVRSDDVEEPFSARKASTLANAAESVPHDAWDAEAG